MKLEGWIKVHRKLTEHWLWDEKPYDKARAWIDLLIMVNHKARKIMFDGSLIEVKTGQKITSLRQLSERWGWSTKKVKSFLECLEKEKMLTFVSDKKKTLISIENYSLYQHEETEKKPQGNAEETLKKLNKNVKNEKNNIYAQQVEQLWSLYPNKQGKAAAVKKIPKLIEEYGYEKIESCIKKYATEVQGRDKKYIKHGSTFFSGGYIDYLNDGSEDAAPKYYWVEDPNTGEQIRKRVGE